MLTLYTELCTLEILVIKGNCTDLEEAAESVKCQKSCCSFTFIWGLEPSVNQFRYLLVLGGILVNVFL